MQPINIFWFRRDLRIEDNTALFHSLNHNLNVLPIFIFDTNILKNLSIDDARVTFIHQCLETIQIELKKHQSSIQCFIGDPLDIWKNLLNTYAISNVFTNKDYEPYGLHRDRAIYKLLKEKQVQLLRYKDHVIFEENDLLKNNNLPYTVYTPYKNAWLKKFDLTLLKQSTPNLNKLIKSNFSIPSLESIGFKRSHLAVKPINHNAIYQYDLLRDFPEKSHTSYAGPHLRFGTISIRNLISQAISINKTYLNELIWREFFMQILYHFPQVITHSFKPKYDNIKWKNSLHDFEQWCQGKTGYPIVDAGMNELNQTGYMHNRVRMICASFLCKHLLIDWRWGEAYFAQKLLDFELASNNGNWQWAAGTGCDAAPYFRVFNPTLQTQKFDPNFNYIQQWIPNFQSTNYLSPIIEHTFARTRAIETYQKALKP